MTFTYITLTLISQVSHATLSLSPLRGLRTEGDSVRDRRPERGREKGEGDPPSVHQISRKNREGKGRGREGDPLPDLNSRGVADSSVVARRCSSAVASLRRSTRPVFAKSHLGLIFVVDFASFGFGFGMGIPSPRWKRGRGTKTFPAGNRAGIGDTKKIRGSGDGRTNLRSRPAPLPSLDGVQKHSPPGIGAGIGDTKKFGDRGMVGPTSGPAPPHCHP
ncbi:hypothetical protein Acr_03g0000160 [Actinidia rufa]|uniref:Uncharacterized protein n=1 Tax=Actinidia rufa TaxID=165716 RepID=A0A7J0EAA9_9ERIC|nr:hypothetical protein Acr_03g0000160 [Actinidia rufa]